MGGNIARRLINSGHRVVGYDVDDKALSHLENPAFTPTQTLTFLKQKLESPRIVWVSVPAGDKTEETLNLLSNLLEPDDIVVDGGNSYYKDTQRRSLMLSSRNIQLLDAGTSGGIWGLENGYSLMVGGDISAFKKVESIFQALAPSSVSGYGRVGPSGSGHFAKMVHNGIEYGMMQSYAEGFEILKAKESMGVDLAQISEIWRHGSVIRSWLLDLANAVITEDGNLDTTKAYAEDSGEGRWAVQESLDLGVPTPVITASLQRRFSSRQDNSFSLKLIAALRNKFGGHVIHREE
ncbi:MAG: 6-phosphogluconate dehydrogenase [Chloroflexi bacterium]|jgi:6-phosphogluconate dehydrogenase|nr:MAG: 6-phosphogluconate dehydrogenase [Chloroflexota bacterium]